MPAGDSGPPEKAHFYPYPDDQLLRGRSQQETAASLECAICLFAQLGLLVNNENHLLLPRRNHDELQI